MFFGVGNADAITYSMYVIGMVVAVVSLIVMRNTSMKGETPPFIMELPTYHMPQFRNLMLHLWDKAKHFIKKAFTIILASTYDCNSKTTIVSSIILCEFLFFFHSNAGHFYRNKITWSSDIS